MARGGAGQLSPVCTYVAERTGTSLSDQQVRRLNSVLERRLDGRTEAQFLTHIQTSQGASDLAELMAAIAVHKTDLFRDETQLEAFRRHVLHPLAHRHKRPLRLWSAGCATGEEVATLLILLAEARADPHSTVLGTDMSQPAVNQASQLTFHSDVLRRVPVTIRARYFRKAGDHHWSLVPELAACATFARHNLMDFPYPAPADGSPFDVIFCRNVLIYFSDWAFDRVVVGLRDRLCTGGTLVLSAAEPILRRQPMLATVAHGEAFFYVRTSPEQNVPPPVRPAPAPPTQQQELRSSPLARVQAPVAAEAVPSAIATATVEEHVLDPKDEAVQLFQLVLEWAAVGDNTAQTEQGLRKCLYLDPHFAQARYLLAVLLEQNGDRAEAGAEFRRALAALVEGRARNTPFFLNNDRLKAACQAALNRLGFR